MKRLFLVIACLLVLSTHVNAQKAESFDGMTYSMPKGWQKSVTPSALQLGIDGAKGACLLTVFKAIPATEDPKKNFESAWDTLVKGVVTVSSKPERQPSTTENGWTVEAGYAPYVSDDKKGTALLITMTGGTRMVNILILTDTDAYQATIATFLESIELPKRKATLPQPEKPKEKSGSPDAIAPQGRFHFSTTNFDDGWTATEQKNWVQVSKGDVTALVHYPDPKADAYNSVLKDGLQNAWNILVAPRYANIRNFALKPIQSFESISFVEADAEDKTSGKTVHVVLFKKHFANGKYIEFIAPSKAAFEQEFGAYRRNEFGWDKLTNMQAKNRFAVASTDLVGKWETGNSASLAYYYADSGRYAGATATSTADTFTFSKAGTYQSDHTGASGMVGSQKFSRQIYKGNFSSATWTLTLTNRFQGEPEKYDCYLEAVKGGRILVLINKQKTVLSLVRQ